MVKRKHSLASLIALGLCLCIANSGVAGVFYVRTSGSDSNSGTNRNQALRTIKKALSKAKGNDVIYVGAGKYSETAYKNYGKNPGSIRIFGDTQGRYTGDKGQVVVESPVNRWGVLVYNANTVMLYNIDFVGKSQNKRSYGCHMRDVKKYVYLYNCTFENLRHGIYTYRTGNTYAIKCTYKDMVYCDYIRQSARALNFNSNYSDVSMAIHYVDVETAYTRNCSFAGAAQANGRAKRYYQIRAYRSGLIALQSNFNDATYGIYGSNLKSLDIRNCNFTNPVSYAIYATGENLAARTVNVQGAGNKKGWGLMLKDQAGAKVRLARVKLEGLYGGIVAAGGEYDFQKVTVQKNHIGLYVARQTPTLTVDETSKLILDDNYFGIYARHQAGKYPGKLIVRNQTIANNTYGIYTHETDLTLEGCTIRENGYGVRTSKAKHVVVKNCDFRDNLARIRGNHYGLYVAAERAEIRDVVSTNNRNGLMVQMQGNSKEPVLRNITLQDNENVGLWLRDGSATIRPKNNIVIQDSRYGLYGYRTNLDIANMTMPSGCQYPLFNYEAELQLSGATISEGTIGVYSVRSPSVNISKTKIEKQKSHGLYLYMPQAVSIAGCESSGNGSHGLYCRAPTGKTVDFSVRNSTFSNNTYGFRTIGLPFDPDHAQNITIADNNHGLRVERAQLWLKPEMNVSFKNNRYAAMSYYGNLKVDDVTIADNEIGLYSWQSKLEATGTKLKTNLYGVICYTGGSKLKNVTVENARYGIYFSARDKQGDTLTVTDSTVDSTKHIAIYGRGYKQPAKLVVKNTNVSGGNYGIYGHTATLDLDNVSATGNARYGISQIYGSGTFSDVTVSKAGSWGLVAYGDSTLINRAKIDSKYGIYLRPKSAKVVNSVIRDSVYGIYTHNPQGNFEILQTTIGNISHYGILHNSGNAVLRNSIVDANIYALWNRSSGTLTHDHNLIHADRKSYVNELPGESEVDKEPIFLDPKAGDLHLAAGSPAINAGMDLSAISTADIEGNARPSFRQFELGAFEYTKAGGSLRVLDWEEKAQ